MPNVHDLKIRLASVCSFVDRIDRHLIGSEQRTREFEELERLLLKAAELTGALIGGRGQGPGEHAPRVRPLDLHEYLLGQETRLQATMGRKMQLTFQLQATDAQVLATAEDLDEIVDGVMATALLARPFGGALTISSGWLDLIGADAVAGLAPRPHMRLTFAAGHETRDAGLSPIASVAANVNRLHGLLILDRAPHEASRIHVCLPIVNTSHSGAA